MEQSSSLHQRHKTKSDKNENEKLTLSSQTPPNEFKLFKLIRLTAVLLWVCTFTVLVWIIMPLNLIVLDPLCKYFRVRSKNYSLEILSRFWAKSILFLLNIKIVIEGDQHLEICQEKATVMVYSHSSYLDPVILQAYSPIPSKFIFKRELLYILPVVFVLAALVGHIPINRKKKDAAIDSINDAAEVVSKYNKCVTISPEGTRSPDGNLQSFKKGAFHLALKSQSTISPVVFFGNHLLWPPTQLLPNSGTSYVRFLNPYRIPQDSTVDSLLDQTREVMLKSLESPPKNFQTFPSKPSAKHSFIFLIIMIPLLYNIFKFLHSYFIDPSLSLVYNNLISQNTTHF
ncbi:hypothetical protein DLAC_09162 [Tieghemostelium lacteum]|uniref:Phospholipid/glycerol acyltransferase domain-containing protein n=1 Tax=Tieghemostelium lacteum TaxID=361077 RepID=A0A151Z9B8_TIELA|nr:hypothetical protein DLAC_09162 [Tieghemostelium lacteum]|eukprot:KYQ90537.1 hypothetical protein DLAC_09162 [Tieghemostelium lacteum]